MNRSVAGPMNILLLAEVSAASVIGGAERMLREQAVGLAKRGHTVGIVARAPLGDTHSQVWVDGIPEFRYVVSRDHEAAFLLSSVRQSVKAFEIGRDGRALDVVLIYQSLAGFGPIRRCAGQACAWIYMCLSLAHEEYLSRRSPGSTPAARVRRALNARARLWIERSVMRRCRLVTVMSEFMKERVQRIHGIPEAKLFMVPGAADVTRFRPPEDQHLVREALNLPMDRTVLFTVRNLTPRMGLENLVEAVALLKEKFADILVLIGGEGPLRESLEARIAALHLGHQIMLLGFVSEEDLPKYFQAADCVVMPTTELEGFGLVTVEALACGTPVLGTPVGAIPEVLARVDPELIAQGTDAASLARAIGSLLRRFRDQPGEQERLSARGCAVVAEDYNWERQNERLETILREACADPRGTFKAAQR